VEARDLLVDAEARERRVRFAGDAIDAAGRTLARFVAPDSAPVVVALDALGEAPLLERVRRAALAARPAPGVRPQVWGVLNVTPDSFSDGGRFAEVKRAVEHGLALEAAGADVLDVGGESTRPGAAPVDARTESERVLPVIERLAARCRRATISVDTMKASVARAAVDAGARWINDPSGGDADPAMLDAAAASGAGYVCMHMRGTPRTMQKAPHYDDVVGEVCEELRARLVRCVDAGVAPERLWLDPGLGFGKRLEDNLVLIERLAELTSLGAPLLVGASRKSFVGTLTGVETPRDRLAGSLAAAVLLAERGASALRVHDVAPTVEALDMAAGVAAAARGAAAEHGDAAHGDAVDRDVANREVAP